MSELHLTKAWIFAGLLAIVSLLGMQFLITFLPGLQVIGFWFLIIFLISSILFPYLFVMDMIKNERLAKKK